MTIVRHKVLVGLEVHHTKMYMTVVIATDQVPVGEVQGSSQVAGKLVITKKALLVLRS